MTVLRRTPAVTPGGVDAARQWTAMWVVYLVWGSTYLGTAVLGESIPPLLGVGVRYLLAGGLLLVFVALWRPRLLRVTAVELRTCVFLGVSMMAFSLGVLALALRYVPTGVAALLVSVVPIWVVIIRLIARERPNWRTLVGVCVGFGGVAVMLAPGGGTSPHGGEGELLIWSAMIVISSGVWAWTSWKAPKMRGPAHTFTANTYQLLIGGVALVLAGLIIGERWDVGAVTARSLWALAYLVVVGSLVAWTAFSWVLRNVPVSLGSTYAYVNPVVAVLLGVFFYSEDISLDVIIGCTVVLAGVVLVVRGEATGMVTKTPPAGESGAREVTTR